MSATLKVRIKQANYQRNGVAGTGFYQVLLSDGKIATFEVTDDDDLKVESCRVTDPSDFLQEWRGDEFAYAIRDELQRLKMKAADFGETRTTFDVLEGFTA